MSKITMEIGSVPPTPAAGKIVVYPKSDLKLYQKDENGLETQFGGTRGILSGPSAPTGSDGVDGDFYIETTSLTIYGPKAAGVWGSGTLMIGATGAQGIQGIQGIQGDTGPQGNVGPQGAQGPFGATGADGTEWLTGSGVPAGGLGDERDFYLNTDNGDIYKKTGPATWSFVTNISSFLGINDLTNKDTLDIDDYLVTQEAGNTLKKVSAVSLAYGNVDRYRTEYDDFLSSAVGSKLSWTSATAGTGASAQIGTYGVNGTEKAMGVVQIDTGTTSTGRCTFSRALNQFFLGYAAFNQYWRVALEALSNSTDRFITHIGFIDNSGAGEHTDGVYFRQVDNVNSGNWQCVCRNAGVETVVNTSVSPNIQYNIFEIDVNEAANEVNFMINNVLVGTITTNIPGPAAAVGIGVKIEKTVGAVQRNLSIDYYAERIEFQSGAR